MKTRCWLVLYLQIYLSQGVNSQAEKTNVWATMAQRDLEDALTMRHNTNVAKNVIFYLGDGMGVSTVTGSRIYKSQIENLLWEETMFSFEKFSNLALSKTYNVDYTTPDSAATATAFLCGVKANKGTLGVDETVTASNCYAQGAGKVTSILKWSQDAGKSVGLVTTARVTHATPAAGYAHSASRGWETDSDMRTDSCVDIAQQLLHNIDLKVIMGGGRRAFLSKTMTDPESGVLNNKRKDGRNLITEWMTLRSKRNQTAVHVWNKRQFDAIKPDETDYILGLFESSHMKFELERDKTSSDTGEPSLAEMTRLAIQILQKNDKGFFLLVEGARIDHAHHGNKAKKAFHEVLAFDDAVSTGVNMTSESDTLLVVTADHSHVFNIGGYPKRTDNILDKVKPVSGSDRPADGMPKTTLIYGNGPGGERTNITDVDTTDNDYRYQAAFKTGSESHAAEDVAIYAHGPMAHLFYGVREQSYIAHAMAYASCVGVNRKHCDVTRRADQTLKRRGDQTLRRGDQTLTGLGDLTLSWLPDEQMNGASSTCNTVLKLTVAVLYTMMWCNS